MPTLYHPGARQPGMFFGNIRVWALLGLLLVLTGLVKSVNAQSLPAPELITSQQGLPQAFVPSIVQDRQGFIWAATHDGLCRYDGLRFKVFQPSADGRPSLSFAGVDYLTLDHQGKLWIKSERGDLDQFDPRTESFTNVSRQPAFRRLVGSRGLNRFCVDRQQRLWAIIGEEELLCFHLRTNQVRRFRHQSGRPHSLGDARLRDVVEGRDGTIWVATWTGLNRFEEKTGHFSHYRRKPNPTNSPQPDLITTLYVRPNGELMTNTRDELLVFSPRTGQFTSYKLPERGGEWWTTHYVTDSRGNTYFDHNSVLFRFSERSGEGPVVVGRSSQRIDDCASLCIDRSDVLWVGTDGAGIRKYDLRPNPFQTRPYARNFHTDLLTGDWLGIPPAGRPNPTTLMALSAYRFRYAVDSAQNLWYNVGSSDVYRINLMTKATEKLPLPVRFSDANGAVNPCPLAADRQGRVWAVHDSLVWFYQASQRQWTPFPHRIPRQRTTIILAFVVDEAALWLMSQNQGLWRLDRRTGQLRQYAHQPADPHSLSNNSLYCLSADPHDPDRLWVGTFGSGLCAFDKRTGRCRRYTQDDGLPNNVIYSALPDQHGYLWLGTNRGLCRLNKRTGETRTYTQPDGLMADEFNRFHYLHLPAMPAQDERIILGGLEGITAFYPQQVGGDAFRPPVELTGLQINNQSVRPGPGSLLGKLPVQAVGSLTLPYDQNFITAEFAVLQFNRRNRIRYRYQLVGLDRTWIETDRPVAIYTDLQPGDYTLRLNGANTAGIWSPHVRTLALTIRPPFWATWWAYLGYALAIGGIAFGLIRQSINRLKLRQSVVLKQREVELKQQEAEQLRATDGMKSRFFANITHEFRTPLTLILAPAEQMMAETPEPRHRRRLLTIEQNAHQLLRLINQLLDLSKLEASVMPVNESRGELNECIGRWLQPLVEQATAQGLELIFTSTVDGSHWFDVEKLERIVYNLVANALKFTERGRITVRLTTATTDSTDRSPTERGPTKPVVLTVADTGRGIPPESLSYVFDRFYQVEAHDVPAEESGDETAPVGPVVGTGIGLALVKELVTLQGGQIAVESQVGNGTTFAVTLPYRSALSIPAAPTDLVLANGAGDHVQATATGAERPVDGESAVPTVLVVEDNDALAHFIAESLPEHYRIVRAVNGRDGWEQALEQGPDLIISDVMMPVQAGPEMDGFTLLGKLKEDLRTSHIPVMLLTAKASVENRMEGLTRGADDYLTKPFQVAELQLRVRNRLAGKQRLREWVRTTLVSPDSLPTPPAPEAPDPFLTQLYDLMDTHLTDADFGVDGMVRELGLSRTNLFRKVKALTDLSAGDLLRQYRLKRATQYLREGLTVSETAYRVGFDSPAYFAKCFREAYQLTPREFAAQA